MKTFTCEYCLEVLPEANKVFDHFIPKSIFPFWRYPIPREQSGRRIKGNIIVSCCDCNYAKSDHVFWSFDLAREFLLLIKNGSINSYDDWLFTKFGDSALVKFMKNFKKAIKDDRHMMRIKRHGLRVPLKTEIQGMG